MGCISDKELYVHQRNKQQMPVLQTYQQHQQKQMKTSQKIITLESIKKSVKKIPATLGKRGEMSSTINFDDNFYDHHYKFEKTLSPYTNYQKIFRRRMLEHYFLQFFSFSFTRQDSIKDVFTIFQAWVQRTFLDIWEIAHDEYFNKNHKPSQVRAKVAEQYIFQMYQLKEFIDAGVRNVTSQNYNQQFKLFYYLQSSDNNLFSCFKMLKEKYPQTSSQGENLDLPNIPSTKTNFDLLSTFKGKSFTDMKNMNVQTTYEDLQFLLNQAIELQQDFKKDMVAIIGEGVLANAKVSKSVVNGVQSFNACAVRRVLIKWAQNLLEKCPELKSKTDFQQFIESKRKIINNFFFKSTVQDTTHVIVIDIVSNIIEKAKNDPGLSAKRKEFTFNIYDLLRCKIKKEDPKDLVEIYERMKALKVTPSGRKFEVIRLKNRFQSNNKDMMVNFRYGDNIIAEAQLGIHDKNQLELAKKNYEFCHYIYELQRSLFGPTLELMMQFEDNSRPDITVSFKKEGVIKKRKVGAERYNSNLKKTDRKCTYGHDMVCIVKARVSIKREEMCKFCKREIDVDTCQFDFCFVCNCILCRVCKDDYQGVSMKDSYILVSNDQFSIPINNLQDLRNQCSKDKSLMVLFYFEGSSPGTLMKDAMVLHRNQMTMLPSSIKPRISFIKINNQKKEFIKQFDLKLFPTLIVFSEYMTPVRTVIGAYFLEYSKMYETHLNLLQGQSLVMPLVCYRNWKKDMTIQNIQKKSIRNQYCKSCASTFKELPIPPQYESMGALCNKQHFRCINCAFEGMGGPSTYQSKLGISYLSSPLRQIKDPKNQKPLELVPIQKLLKYRQPELALHYIEPTAEEAVFCLCSYPFKKVYTSRQVIFGEEVESDKPNWRCSLCQNKFEQGILHLACFNCSYYNYTYDFSYDFEICLDCAEKTEALVRRKNHDKDAVTPMLLCQSDHQIVNTTLKYDEDLAFNCTFCKNRYYIYSERYYCKICKTSCCINDICLNKLSKTHQFETFHKCTESHKLEITCTQDETPGVVSKESVFKLCDGCFKIIRAHQFYFCCKKCKYFLCLNCTSNNKVYGKTPKEKWNKQVQHLHFVRYQKGKKQIN